MTEKQVILNNWFSIPIIKNNIIVTIARPTVEHYSEPSPWGLVVLYALAHLLSIQLMQLHWGNWGMFWLPSGVGALRAIFWACGGSSLALPAH